jgi:hypothetical protein
MTLVTTARYVAITGDTATAAATVSARIEDATDLLENHLGRGLEAVERTETLWYDRAGWLWPTATPITAADGWTIDGHGLRGGSTWDSAYWPTDSPTSISVTYIGGYVERTANPTAPNRLPATVERDLAWAAYVLIRAGTLLAGIPNGVTSISVGDISVSFPEGSTGRGVDEMSIRWSRATRRFARRGV